MNQRLLLLGLAATTFGCRGEEVFSGSEGGAGWGAATSGFQTTQGSVVTSASTNGSSVVTSSGTSGAVPAGSMSGGSGGAVSAVTSGGSGGAVSAVTSSGSGGAVSAVTSSGEGVGGGPDQAASATGVVGPGDTCDLDPSCQAAVDACYDALGDLTPTVNESTCRSMWFGCRGMEEVCVTQFLFGVTEVPNAPCDALVGSQEHTNLGIVFEPEGVQLTCCWLEPLSSSGVGAAGQ